MSAAEALDPVLGPDGRHQPQRGVREHGEERPDLHLHVGRRQVVVVEPLGEEAARREPVARGLEELAREQVGHAGDPRVRRLRDDHVEGPGARSRWLRPSRNTSAKRGSRRSGSRERRRNRARPARSPARSRRTRALSIGCAAAAAAVAPAPQPITSARRGDACSSSGTCARNFCVTTSSVPLPASVLPFTDRKRRAAVPALRHRHDGLTPPRGRRRACAARAATSRARRGVELVDPLQPVTVHSGRHSTGSQGRSAARRTPRRRRSERREPPDRRPAALPRRAAQTPAPTSSAANTRYGDCSPSRERARGRRRARRRWRRRCSRRRGGRPPVARRDGARSPLETEARGGAAAEAQPEATPCGTSVAKQRARKVSCGRERHRQQPERGQRDHGQPADRPGAGQHREPRPTKSAPDRPRGVGDPRTSRRVERRADRDPEQDREQHQVEGIHGRADHERVRARPQHLDAEGRGARREGELEAAAAEPQASRAVRLRRAPAARPPGCRAPSAAPRFRSTG